MPVETKTQTEQEIAEQNKSQEGRASSLLDSLKTSSFVNDIKDLPKEEVEEEAQEEVSQDEPELEESEVEENAQDETEEELIPKSKVQSRIDKLTNEIKLLREAQKVQPQAKSDDVSDQLENMSDGELKSLKRQVRSAQLRSTSDEVALNKLLDLEEKIDETIRSAPSKFASRQLEAYNQAAEDLANDDSLGDMKLVAPKLLEIAKEIYSSEPELQRTIQGQAIALKLAAKHFKAVNNLSKSSTENKVLKSQVNTFKKKTSLDGKVMKGSLEKGKLESTRQQAFRGGTMHDKMSFIKEDPRFRIKEMLPDFKIG